MDSFSPHSAQPHPVTQDPAGHDVRPRTILFDIDGTLLDTSEFILAAFEHAGSILGFRPPERAVLAAHHGDPLRQIYTQLSGADRAGEAIALHREFQRRNLSLVHPFEGVADLLASLVAGGIALAAVTSRSRITALPTLQLTGLDRFFRAVVAAEDAPALKPDPAPLRLALEMLGRTAVATWMVGDAPHDIRAGRALALHTVGALYGFRRSDVLAERPDHAISSPPELRDLVERHRA